MKKIVKRLQELKKLLEKSTETIDTIKRKYSQNFTKVELEKLTANYYSLYAARIVRDFII